MKKFLSVLLSLLLVFSVCSVAATADTAAPSYYVIKGGTGDGRTAETPAATVYDAVSTAIADGLTAEDTATVYIMQKEWTNTSELTCWTDFAQYGIMQNHAFTLEVKPYDTEITTYLLYHNKANANEWLTLGGTTVFENITIVSDRNNYDPIVTYGHDVTFGEGVKYGSIGTSFGTSVKSYGALMLSLGYYNKKQVIDHEINVTFKNEFATSNNDVKNTSIYLGSTGPAKLTYNADVNLTFDNPNIYAYLNWGNGNVNGDVTFNKNVNIYAKAANTIGNTQSVDATVTVNGAVQFIYGSSTTIAGDFDYTYGTFAGGVYKIKNKSSQDDLLSFTETAGKYAVKEGYTAYITDANNNVFTSKDGFVTVPASGDYTVSDENPDVPVVKDTNYYVINGGTGDGDTAATPAATVNDAIATAVEDGYTAGDTVTVYIMQKSWTSTSELTYWADSSVGRNITAHDFTVEIKPYDATVTTYLVYHNRANYNEFMVLGGPTIFDDITIVCCRNNYDPISLLGNSATFRDGVKYGTIGTSFGDKVAEKSGLLTTLGYYMVKTNVTEKVDIVFENAFVTPSNDIKNSSIVIGAYGPETATYNEDVSITFDNAETNAYLNWGNINANGSLTLKKNLNVNIKNATAITNNQWIDGAVVNVEGAVQFIYNSATTLTGEISDLNGVTVTGGVYKIKNETAQADFLTFTDDAGVYAVKDGCTAYATDAEGKLYTSENGLLTVPAGEYTVSDEAPEEPVNYGDANDDGVIDILDLIRAKKLIADNAELCPAVDMNGDGEMTSADLVEIKKLILNIQ